MIQWIRDRWLTWRTGLTREQREEARWCDLMIVHNANTIENMFHNFEYIIPVSTSILNDHPFLGWAPCDEFQEYLYPQRTLGDNAVWYFARGYRDPWDGRFHLSDLRAEQDQVFVATNSETDAMIIALRWS